MVDPPDDNRALRGVTDITAPKSARCLSCLARSEGVMPWYNIINPLPDGRRELIVRIKCDDDASAADDLSAEMFPGAQVWEGGRFVAALPPLRFPRGDRDDSVVLVHAKRLVSGEP